MAKFTGKGAQIGVKTTGATPAWVFFGQIAEIGSIDQTADEVDVTTLDGGDFRDFIQGFKDAGECQITVMFDPAMTDQNDSADGWLGLFASGETRDWVIRFNSSGTGGASFGTFTGFVRDMSYGALNPDDPQQLQPTIRISSPITLEDTMPTIQTEPPGTRLSREEAEFARRRAELDRMEADLKRRRAEHVRAQEEMPVAA